MLILLFNAASFYSKRCFANKLLVNDAKNVCRGQRVKSAREYRRVQKFVGRSGAKLLVATDVSGRKAPRQLWYNYKIEAESFRETKAALSPRWKNNAPW